MADYFVPEKARCETAQLAKGTRVRALAQVPGRARLGAGAALVGVDCAERAAAPLFGDCDTFARTHRGGSR